MKRLREAFDAAIAETRDVARSHRDVVIKSLQDIPVARRIGSVRRPG